MFQLSDGCLLYHGSYVSIPDIDLTKCHTGLDFGNGFYLTSSFEQARSYIPLSVAKAKRMRMIPGDYSVNDGQIAESALFSDGGRNQKSAFCEE